MRKRSKILILLLVMFIILLGYLAVVAGGAYRYLKQYGYGKEELPKTLAVYFH